MITFLFYFKPPGGVPSLYYRIASVLHKMGVEYQLICYRDSEIYRLFSLIDPDFNFLDYMELSEETAPLFVGENDILVTTYWDPKLIYFKKVNPRFFFWNVFQYTLRDANKVRHKYFLHAQNRRLIHTMLNHQGLVFMDGGPFAWLESKYGILPPEDSLLPIPVPEVDLESVSHVPFTGDLQLSYVGRAVDWKLFPVLRIVKDINSSIYKEQITLTLVTDDAGRVDAFLKEHGVCPQFRLRHIESIPNERMKDFFINHVHLNIAMATAALESAGCGVPTLVVDPSYGPIGEEKAFLWLYDSRHFYTGDFNRSAQSSKISLAEALAVVFEQGLFLQEAGEKCAHYVRTKHGLESVGREFLQKVRASRLRFRMIKEKVINYSTLYEIKRWIRGQEFELPS